MRILVLGGDGYLGWPQALYLSAQGHDVYVIDSLMRRRFDLEHGIDSLTPNAAAPSSATTAGFGRSTTPVTAG